jgi:hypothetical protein
MTDDEPFDIKKYTIPPGMEVRERLAVVPRKIQKERNHFIKVPMVWVERLAGVHHLATYKVAMHVLYQHWRGGSEPFTLSNVALVRRGVDRFAKWRALSELEQLDLITIERRPNRSPRITVKV